MDGPVAVERVSDAPTGREPRAAVLDFVYGAAVLVLCTCIWQASRPGWFPPEYRQTCRSLLRAVESLREGLDPQSRVWIVCQDREADDLNWRRIAYALIPERVLYLPRNVREPCEVGLSVVDPEQGSRGSLHSDSIAFSDGASFRRYLTEMNVNRLVIINYDNLVSELTGIERPTDRMYLLDFDRASGQFTDVLSVPRP